MNPIDMDALEAPDAPTDRVERSAEAIRALVAEVKGLRSLAEVPVTQARTETEHMVKLLAESQRRIKETDEALAALQDVLLERARTLGVSWQRIGDAMQMTPQGVYKKAGAWARDGLVSAGSSST